MNYRKLLYQVIIIIYVFLLYGNTLVNDYALDDNLVTWMNPKVQKGFEGINEIFTTTYYKTADSKFGYRPVVQFLFAVEYEIFGESPFVSHLINLLLYCITGLFLFKILQRLFRNEKILLPFFITLLFLGHPLHTEVVASLKNREEILSFLLGISALWFFIKFSDRNKIINIVFAVLFFALAYLSKESAIVFVVVIPIAIHFFTNKRLTSPIVIFLFLYLIVRLMRGAINQYIPSENELLYFENPLHFNNDIFIQLGSGFITMLEYLKLLIFPHPLVYYYGYDMIPIVGIFNVYAILSAIIHLGLVLFIILRFKKQKIISFGLIIYLTGVLLFSNLIVPINGIVGERLVYIASLGFAVIVGYLIYKFSELKKKRILGFTILSFILISYTVKTITRNFNWKDDGELYAHDIKYLDNSAKANGVYATKLLFELAGDQEALRKEATIEKSLKHFNRSIEIYEDYYSSYNNIGYIYAMFYGDYDRALTYINKALEIRPNYAEANFYKGFCYEKKGDFETSIVYYKRAVENNPEYFEAISKLANWNNNIGDFRTAIDLNKRMIQIDPNSDLPYLNVGNYFFFKQDTVHALKYWEISFQKNPNNHYMLMNLVNLYKQIGDTKKHNFYNQKLLNNNK